MRDDLQLVDVGAVIVLGIRDRRLAAPCGPGPRAFFGMNFERR